MKAFTREQGHLLSVVWGYKFYGLGLDRTCSVWSRRRQTWMPDSSFSSVSCCACRPGLALS